MSLTDKTAHQGLPDVARDHQHVPPPPLGDAWSFQDSPFTPIIPMGADNRTYTELKKALVLLFQEARQDFEVKILELNRGVETQLDFSFLLVTILNKDRPKVGVAMHLLQIADTYVAGEIPPVTVRHSDNRVVNFYRMPSDAVDETVVIKAIDLASRVYGKIPLYWCDALVVNKLFDVKDIEQVRRLARVSSNACTEELARRTQGYSDINIAKINKANNCTVGVEFRSMTLRDAVNNPVRSDLTIVFSDRKPGSEQNRGFHTGGRITPISRLSGYVDSVWAPGPEVNNAYMGYANMGHVPTQRFGARMILTDVESQHRNSYGSTLLALSTALCMKNPQYWMLAFRPTLETPTGSSSKGTNIKNIGAFNHEANLPMVQSQNGVLMPNPSGYGNMIDTASDEFRTEQFVTYMHSIFHKELALAVDVPECGAQSPYLGFLSAAARGIPDAIKLVIDTANCLTNGEFGKHFDQSMSIFAHVPERIHNGYYTDHAGQIRDIREIDYLAVANIVGKNNPVLIRDWSDTFLRVDYPEDLRLESRRKMITSMTNDTAVFLGWSQRLTFSRVFISALEKGIAANPLHVSLVASQNGPEMNAHRAVASYFSDAAMSTGQAAFANYGMQQGPAVVGSYQQFRYGQ